MPLGKTDSSTKAATRYGTCALGAKEAAPSASKASKSGSFLSSDVNPALAHDLEVQVARAVNGYIDAKRMKDTVDALMSGANWDAAAKFVGAKLAEAAEEAPLDSVQTELNAVVVHYLQRCKEQSAVAMDRFIGLNTVEEASATSSGR